MDKSIRHATYRFEQRPQDVSHGHLILVFDRQSRIHLPLTVFAKSALAGLTAATVRVYLYAILPFFNFLEEDIWQVRAGRRWNSEPEEVRIAVDDYLIQRLRCKVRDHRLGFQLVAITTGTHSHIRIFLSALKLFYWIMYRERRYAYDNPLVDVKAAASIAAARDFFERESGTMLPPMPERSGVTEPRYSKRLSDSYFRLEGEEWVPRIIDDPDFPSLIHYGGKLVGWKLREKCVADLLFDSGARISEVAGQTLGDWIARGMAVESRAFSKGSRGRRVKFLRFSNNTAKMLRRYFNTERRRHDPYNYALEDYIRLAKRKLIDLYGVPLFLTAQRTPLTPKVFRDNYWNPACEAVSLEADVHQTRHWYVTMEIRHIYETSISGAEVERRKGNLIAYMGWKSKETIEVYEHYFSAARYVEEGATFQDRSDQALALNLKNRRENSSLNQQMITTTDTCPDLDGEQNGFDFDFLRRIGGMT
jgi:integrase